MRESESRMELAPMMPNRWSSERHRACTFGWVATEEDSSQREHLRQ